MRARTIGMRVVRVAPPLPSTAASKRAAWWGRMSMKKKAGARSGIWRRTWSIRLPWISAMATSTVAPRPRDRMTLAVGAPGRWMLASARRKFGPRRMPRAGSESRAAPRATSQARPRNSRKAPAQPQMKIVAMTGSAAVSSASPASAATSSAVIAI